MTEDFVHGLETTLFTSLSVALETMETMMSSIPASVGGPQLGYLKAAAGDARRELDLFLVDRDYRRLDRAKQVIETANNFGTIP